MTQPPPTPNDAAPIHEAVIQWHEETDDDGNTFWTADSPLHVDDVPFEFVIIQAIKNNSIVYLCNSDYQCCGDCGNSWPTLAEAKAAFEEMNRTILRELENAK